MLSLIILIYLNVSHNISGFTFYLGLILDGFDKYEDTSDFELTVITELPEFEIWEGVTSHESGDILMIQVRYQTYSSHWICLILCYI